MVFYFVPFDDTRTTFQNELKIEEPFETLCFTIISDGEESELDADDETLCIGRFEE